MERRAPIDEGRARELLVKERERLASLWEQLNREGMGQNSLREGLAELMRWWISTRPIWGRRPLSGGRTWP